MTRIAPGLFRLATFTSEAYPVAAPSLSPADGCAPTWHVVQARRPAESVELKMSRWMLEKVGSNPGVGPAKSLSFSSHADTHTTETAKASHRLNRRIALPSGLI